MFKALLAIVTFSAVASASAVTFTTPIGSTDSTGDPVSATATFTTGAGFVDITFQNLLVGQKDVGQSISDLQFVLSTGQTSGTIGSSSGLERTVNSGKTYTDGAVVATGWSLQNNTGGGLRLFVLGTAIGPAHTVIGAPSADNLYDNANGSMAGNGPHNPFLAGTQSYHLLITGVTASSTVTGGYFSFGTTEGDNVKFGTPVPEPISSALVGTGLISLFFLRRRTGQKA